MYSACVSFILVGMICAGASQTVAARALLQSGFEYPLFLSILYHAGQSLSLISYVVIPKSWQNVEEELEANNDDTSRSSSSSLDLEANVARNCRADRHEAGGRRRSSYIGSRHGLGQNAEEAAQWVERIPRFWMPIISAFFGLTNNALRFGSLLFIAASVAEMINSGLELTLSVLAARFLRKRMISPSRWAGVAIVTAGVILVGLVNILTASNGEQIASAGSNVRDQTVGIALIVGQSILSVLQDITQEFFLQEAQFPPLLMLGLLGLSALSIALIVYFPCHCIGPRFTNNTGRICKQFSADCLLFRICSSQYHYRHV